MRGSLTMIIESNPIIVSIRDDNTMITAVHIEVFKRSFDDRNLFTAIATDVNKRGTTIYLPNLSTISRIKEIALLTEGLSTGRIRAQATPMAIPIKYFTQTFIFCILSQNCNLEKFTL